MQDKERARVRRRTKRLPETRPSRPGWPPETALGAVAAPAGRLEPPCSLESSLGASGWPRGWVASIGAMRMKYRSPDPRPSEGRQSGFEVEIHLPADTGAVDQHGSRRACCRHATGCRSSGPTRGQRRVDLARHSPQSSMWHICQPLVGIREHHRRRHRRCEERAGKNEAG